MIRQHISTARLLLLLAVALLLGAAGLSSYTGTSPLLQKLSCHVRDALTSASTVRDSSSIASAGCGTESKKSGEIYYVSCGGFF